MSQTAAILTIGSELTAGLRVDTNTAEIARALAVRGFSVAETVSVGDDAAFAAASMQRLLGAHALVITTGGLGPTHDDITRDAAASALGAELVRDERIARMLESAAARHADPEASEQVFSQALVLPGAKVIDFTSGTAPGLVIEVGHATLVLLPGPPSEMRPMLSAALERYPATRCEPADLGVVGLTESDAQVRASRALSGVSGVGFTILAKPGDVRILLNDQGAGEDGIARATESVAEALGAHCYSTDGSTLADVVIAAARANGRHIAVAESCTGGMIASSLTDIPGASEVFLGGVVAYSNAAKGRLLNVPDPLLAMYGAVSEETARAMAEGARDAFDADVALAVTGVAGPAGGTTEKPVGLVWFAIASPAGVTATRIDYPPSGRDAVRARARATGLDLLRRSMVEG